MPKLWEAALLLIVVAIAAKLVVAYVIPVIPYVAAIAVMMFIIGGMVNHKRKW